MGHAVDDMVEQGRFVLTRWVMMRQILLLTLVVRSLAV